VRDLFPLQRGREGGRIRRCGIAVGVGRNKSFCWCVLQGHIEDSSAFDVKNATSGARSDGGTLRCGDQRHQHGEAAR